MKNAIQKAIEGGWKSEFGYNGFKYNKKSWEALYLLEGNYFKAHLLDPLFWQCLGKQQEWLEIEHTHMVTKEKKVTRVWLEYWKKFIDHIADGSDVDEFFNNLIK